MIARQAGKLMPQVTALCGHSATSRSNNFFLPARVSKSETVPTAHKLKRSAATHAGPQWPKLWPRHRRRRTLTHEHIISRDRDRPRLYKAFSYPESRKIIPAQLSFLSLMRHPLVLSFIASIFLALRFGAHAVPTVHLGDTVLSGSDLPLLGQEFFGGKPKKHFP
jgi:hypothetical protein